MVTLVLATIVVIGFKLLDLKSNKDERRVIVTGLWTPSPRMHDAVHVFITVGPRAVFDSLWQMAPVQKAYSAKPGERVEIRLTMVGAGRSNFIGCSIAVEGYEAINDHKQGDLGGGANIACWTLV